MRAEKKTKQHPSHTVIRPALLYCGTALIGFGVIPATLLWFDILQAPPSCSSHLDRLTGQQYDMVCGNIPDSYHVGALVSTMLVVLGIGMLLWQRYQSNHATEGKYE